MGERLGGYGFAQMATFFIQVLGPSAAAQTLAQLVFGFFAFYSEDFDWAQECVSVATGRRVFKGFECSKSSPHLSIEDCFDKSHDICMPYLSGHESLRLRAEMQRAWRLLQQPGV